MRIVIQTAAAPHVGAYGLSELSVLSSILPTIYIHIYSGRLFSSLSLSALPAFSFLHYTHIELYASSSLSGAPPKRAELLQPKLTKLRIDHPTEWLFTVSL